MFETTCVELFKTFTKSELKEFGSYLSTTYKKTGSIYKLYVYLKNCQPNFTEAKLDRKQIEKKLYSEKSDPKRTLFDATSKLTAQLKDFITIQELKKNDVHKNFLYLEALKLRKLDRLFFKNAENLEKEWQDDSIPGIEYFHNEYKLKVLKYSHPNFSLQKIKNASELKNIIDLLEQHYITSKMYHTLIYNINNKETITEKYSINKILNNIDLSNFSTKTILYFLFNLLSAYQLNTVEAIKEIKKTFFKVHYLFTESEKHDIVSILNYLFYSKRNEIEVHEELFEIVKFSLNNGLLLEDGYLSNQSFYNCIHIAKANNEIEWIETFILEYKELLSEKDMESCVLFGSFAIHFLKNQFKDALEKLSFINIKVPNRIAQLNCCRVQCLYELKYDQALYHAINQSNQYLFNHQEGLKESNNYYMFKSFLTTVKKLLSVESNLHTNNSDKLNQVKNLQASLMNNKNKPYDETWIILITKRLIKKFS